MRRGRLERIRRAYDLTLRQHEEGIDPLSVVPEDFKNSPEFQALMRDSTPETTGSGNPAIREFLDPRPGMNCLDVGCCANLANHGFGGWPSLYFGVDISPELIKAMREFAARKKIAVGGLEVAEAAALPFAGDCFDIAMAVGVLEYTDFAYAGRALAELGRVLKSGARVVLDIPNMGHAHAPAMLRLEEYLKRPAFPHRRPEFESRLARHFIVEKIDDRRVMVMYFLRRKGRE
jgi:SAM-dependent methyltransferase